MPFEIIKKLSGREKRRRYDPFIFNKAEYHGLWKAQRALSFYLLDKASLNIYAEIHFVLEDGVLISLPKASFGSFQFSDDITDQWLAWFLDQIEQELRELTIDRVLIRAYPDAYAPVNASRQSRLLKEHGYHRAYTDTSFHIDLTKDFAGGLKESEFARLRSLKNKGFMAELWERPDPEEVYRLLLSSRKARGYPMTMAPDDFARVFDRSPSIYKVFRVTSGDCMVAAGVTVHVNDRILYSFYVGESPGYRKYSPVVGLIASMARYGLERGYSLFDLGIATDKGALNEGLARFKINMGGIPSDKPMFEKKLNS